MDQQFKQEVDNEIEEIETQKKNDSYRLAGFWIRCWAYLLDLVVIGSIDRLIVHPIFRIADVPLHDGSMFSPISIVSALVFYGYFVLMTKWWGQTIGKMVFGIKVVSEKQLECISWSSVIFREIIGRYLSVTIFILYIIVAFTSKKQGLHDMFADTVVIHERALKTIQTVKPA